MTTLGVNISTQDPTYGWADVISPRTYSRLTPPRVSAAESRARQLYQLYDRLVDQAIDAGTRELAVAIDDTWQEYKAANDYAEMLRRQYTADLNPERWF